MAQDKMTAMEFVERERNLMFPTELASGQLDKYRKELEGIVLPQQKMEDLADRFTSFDENGKEVIDMDAFVGALYAVSANPENFHELDTMLFDLSKDSIRPLSNKEEKMLGNLVLAGLGKSFDGTVDQTINMAKAMTILKLLKPDARRKQLLEYLIKDADGKNLKEKVEMAKFFIESGLLTKDEVMPLVNLHLGKVAKGEQLAALRKAKAIEQKSSLQPKSKFIDTSNILSQDYSLGSLVASYYGLLNGLVNTIFWISNPDDKRYAVYAAGSFGLAGVAFNEATKNVSSLKDSNQKTGFLAQMFLEKYPDKKEVVKAEAELVKQTREIVQDKADAQKFYGNERVITELKEIMLKNKKAENKEFVANASKPGSQTIIRALTDRLDPQKAADKEALDYIVKAQSNSDFNTNLLRMGIAYTSFKINDAADLTNKLEYKPLYA